jgi:excisionase family DNA binding protein
MRVPRLLSVAQVSAKLQCARSTVRKLVADGELRASRISSRTIRISEADIQAYLDDRANISAPAAPSMKANGTTPEPTVEQRDTDGTP